MDNHTGAVIDKKIVFEMSKWGRSKFIWKTPRFEIFFSFTTPVAIYDVEKDELRYTYGFSTTTRRHVKMYASLKRPNNEIELNNFELQHEVFTRLADRAKKLSKITLSKDPIDNEVDIKKAMKQAIASSKDDESKVMKVSDVKSLLRQLL